MSEKKGREPGEIQSQALREANARLEHRTAQLEASAKVGHAITSIFDMDELLRQTVSLISDYFGFYHAGIFLLDEPDSGGSGGEWATLREATGEAGAKMKAQGHRLAVGETSMVGWTALHCQPRVALDVGEDAVRFDNPLLPHTRSEMTLPLMVGERVLGVLNIQSTEEAAFGEDDVQVLQNMADQVAVAIENARLFREAVESAHAYAAEQEVSRQLRQQDRFKRRFLANMSHELRTPLTNIMGFSQLMLKGLDGPLTELQMADVKLIHENSRHLLGLINDLLDISQIQAGLMELEFREVDLEGLIHSVLATASALVRDKDVELRQEIAPDLPTVQIDATRIRQVLLGLLANATQFTEEGSIIVRARPDGEYVLVSVSDTGVGIPLEEQESIFQPFEHGRMKGDRQSTGVGLGLALSKEFVEMHSGRIWVESEVGKGSTFTISLPVRQESEQE